jgi:hypothetical protein
MEPVKGGVDHGSSDSDIDPGEGGDDDKSDVSSLVEEIKAPTSKLHQV